MFMWLWSVVHNCLVHPLMPFLPFSWVDELHDWTGTRAFGAAPPVHVLQAIKVLNEALALDAGAINNLFDTRVMVNRQIGNHPTIQVNGTHAFQSLGVLGLLNGCMGIIHTGPRKEWGWITAVVDDGRIVRFEVTQQRGAGEAEARERE